MYTTKFGKNLTGAALALAALLLAAGSARPGTFVSYNGRFHFDYPGSWSQLDYVTAEFYLTRGDTTRQIDFEAVFCDERTALLFHDQYLILTVDTIGPLSAEQIDSISNALTAEFGRPIREVTSEAFLASSLRNEIAFDRSSSRFAIETEVPGDSSGTKINLLVMQIYERGIANFFFYSPTPAYARNLPLYRDMVATFSTSPLPATAAAEPVKVADIEAKSEPRSNYPLYFGAPIAIILIVLAVRLRKKRQQSTGAGDRKG